MKNVIKKFTSLSKRKLIAMLSMGFLLSISCAGLMFYQQILTERNESKEQIQALKDALVKKADAAAQAKKQALIASQEATKKALEPLKKPMAKQKTNTTPQQTTTTTTTTTTPTQQEPEQTNQQDVPQSTAQTEETAEVVNPTEQLENGFDKNQENKQDLDPKPAQEKKSTADPARGYYTQESNTKKNTKTKSDNTNDILAKQLEKNRQRYIENGVEEAKKDCIKQIQRNVKKTIGL